MRTRATEAVTRRFSGRSAAQLKALGCAVVAALCLPAASGASSGGAAVGPPPGATAQAANVTVTASSNGMTIAAPESTPLRSAVVVRGSLSAAEAGRSVEIEVLGARTNWSWQLVAQTRVRGGGSFSAAWSSSRAGQFAVRAVVAQARASAATGVPTVTVFVYRTSLATLYGPGFYGHRTACGTILRRTTIGVANRTLPCGTRVAVYFAGRMMVVPVIDRGPYANGANWDLTMATGAALGMNTTEAIGAVAIPRRG